MEQSLLKTTIKEFCENNNIQTTDSQLECFEDMLCELKDFNSKINVTALRKDEPIIVRHFCDSITPLFFDLLPPNASVLDVGCGAGFPGLPLKVMRNDISLSLLDSTEKKLRFSASFSQKHGFEVTPIAKRAEEIANTALRESFDVVVSRAVAALPVLLELCLPFVKEGGKLICFKSLAECDEQNPKSELSMAKKAISILGGKIETIYKQELPKESDEDKAQVHALIVIKKIKKCSTIYPRRYAQIVKKPL